MALKRAVSSVSVVSGLFFFLSAAASPSVLQLSLTRVQILFQLPVNHSANEALVFGSVCPLSASLALWRLRPHSLFPAQPLVSTLFLFFTTAQAPFKKKKCLLPVSRPLLLSFPVPGVNQFGLQHMLQQPLSWQEGNEKTFYPQPEIVDNERSHPTGHRFIFHWNTCAWRFVRLYFKIEYSPNIFHHKLWKKYAEK